jgi:hypothetical protein
VLLSAAAAAAETQDVEESTSCVVVTLVMLAQGTVSMPDDVISDVQTFKKAMKQVGVSAVPAFIHPATKGLLGHS